MLELSNFQDGVCVEDTLTILGAKGGVATPVCGNMTGYSSECSTLFISLPFEGIFREIRGRFLNLKFIY